MTVVEYIVDEFEGGRLGGPYTDDPRDRGGATRWGVTQRLAALYYGRAVTKAEIRDLPLGEAVKILQEMFVARIGYRGVTDWRVRLVATDFAVNFGADDATPALQRAVGAKPDGVFGPVSTRLTNEANAPRTILRVMAARQFRHVQESYKPNQLAYIRGWINRTSTLMTRVTWEEGLT